MSRKSICPICGSEIPLETAICPVCKANLNTLPQNIFSSSGETIEPSNKEEITASSTPVINPTEEVNTTHAAESPIPDWMRKRLQNQSAAGKEKSKFDYKSYEDMLFNSETSGAQPKSAASDRYQVPAASKNAPSILEPPLIIEEEAPKTANTPEDMLVDFSVYRPNKKWDEPSTDRATNSSHTNRELFSNVVGSEKVLWEGIDAPLIESSVENKNPLPDSPALHNCVAPGKADMDSIHKDDTRKNRKQRKRKLAPPMLPEQAIQKEEQRVIFTESSENKELIPESGSLVSALIEQIDKNTEPVSKQEISDITDLPILTESFPINPTADTISDEEGEDSGEDINEVLDHYLQQVTSMTEKVNAADYKKTSGQSDHARNIEETPYESEKDKPLQDNEETEIPWELLDSNESTEPITSELPTVSENISHNDTSTGKNPSESHGTVFYSQKEPAATANIPPSAQRRDIVWDNTENNSAEIVDVLMRQFGYHVEGSAIRENNNSQPENEDVTIPENEEIPAVEESFAEQDDEIPWDLFGKGDMIMPQTPVAPAYRTFSRTGIPTESGATSYQRKMLSSVLGKIIQAENEIVPRKQSTARHIPLSARLFWALIAIVGVVFILLSDATDSLIATRQPMTENSQSFVQAIKDIQGEVLVVIDYTPAYGSILDEPLHKLNHLLISNGCKLRLCVMNSINMPNAYQQIEKDAEILNQPEWWPASAISIRAHLDAGDLPENICLITADAASVQTWGEQLYAAGGTHNLHVLAPEQLEPVLVTWLNAGIISSAIFRENDYETFTDGTQLHKLGRHNYAVWYLAVLLIIAWPCGILINFIRNDSLSSDKKERMNAVPLSSPEDSEKYKGGGVHEQQL